MPRLYRQSPLNAIWEGSGNVICLDILRCLAREPDAVAALRAELATGVALSPNYDAAIVRLEDHLAAAAKGDVTALRVVAGTAATLLQACALRRTAPEEIAVAFVEARLTPCGRLCGGPHFGQLDSTPTHVVDLLLHRAAGGVTASA